jgi:anthranilate phosphoribosyltransferase
VEPLATALGELGAERALVVHGSDGLDEITTTGPTSAALWDGAAVVSLTLDPAALGIARARPDALRGGTPAENADLLRRVLDGETGAPRDLVLANAGAALWVAGRGADWAEGVEAARESLDSGAARERLAALVRASAEAEDGA